MGAWSVRYLSRDDVAACAPRMADIVTAVEDGFRLVGRGRVQMPPKPSLHGEAGAFSQVMVAAVPDAGALGVKWITLVPANAGRGLALAHAVIVLSDPTTGRPAAVMEAGQITAWRTGAGVAVAARHLALPGTDVVGVLGCGVQARAAVEALAVTMSLRRVQCCDRRPEAARVFAAELAASLPDVECAICLAPAGVAAGAGLVVTAITMGPAADAPLAAGLLEPGALAVALDYDAAWTSAAMAECDRFFCDDVPQLLATKAVGERLGGIPARVDGDLGALAAGAVPGRARADQRIFCMNLGVAVCDMVTARLVLDHAVAAGIGRELPL
jgi:alanine dehydrogenase